LLSILIFFTVFTVFLDRINSPNATAQTSEDYPDQGDMVLIPAGEFIMGSSSEEVKPIIEEFGKRGDFIGYSFESETPRRKINVGAFYIDRYEVTNTQYKTFINATGHLPPRHWKNGTFASGKDNHPAMYVSWFDAEAYASWAGKRLPTEEEWEKASRGIDGRTYPWGSKYNPEAVGTAEGILRTNYSPIELTHFAAPVDEFKGDKSPYGVYDMAGNVMEWTGSWYEKGDSKVVKGAAWVHLGARARSAARAGIQPSGISHLIGFRCAMDVDKKSIWSSVSNLPAP
jgi:formylglycine-generating enzyme required for sulfatase activity